MVQKAQKLEYTSIVLDLVHINSLEENQHKFLKFLTRRLDEIYPA